MKYIRTKDYVLLQDINNDKYCKWLETEPTINDIVKQADTIEELCDEFVIDEYNGLIHKVVCVSDVSKDMVIRKEKYGLDKNAKLFGAIWTNKGLIYVAKMNDKGKLELL